MMKHHWQQAVADCQKSVQAFSLVTIVGAAGSTPRDSGSKMVVTCHETFDTIGGGKLEYLATHKARELLLAGEQCQRIHHFPLAAEANQCCGGSVTVLFEVFPCAANEVVLFGAGHVARALVKILAELDMHITWVDSREDLYPEVMPAGVDKLCLEEPERHLDSIPAGAIVIIVTHDHALDYRLVKETLEEGSFAFLGVIGSDTKAARFRRRLAHDGFNQDQIARVTTPIGLPNLGGKLPMEVAVSIAAQLLTLTATVEQSRRRGLSWKEMKAVFATDTE